VTKDSYSRWERVKALFEAASARPPAERRAYLDDARGADEQVRHRVERMLEHCDPACDFLEQPVLRLGDPRTQSSEPSTIFSPDDVINDRFKIVRHLASGGIGEVYQARDLQLHRDVAIKVVRRWTAPQADAFARLRQEALATARLNHPNVVTVYEIGHHNGELYVVSELLVGKNLRERLAAGAMPPSVVIDWAKQIASALDVVHAHGIIHRDLKPENVFITDDGRVKLLDFGLTKLVAATEQETSASGLVHTAPFVVLGTRGYISPEQLNGHPADYRADIYACGVILRDMINASRGHNWRDRIPWLGALPALRQIAARCTELSPDRRYQSARDLYVALDRIHLRSRRHLASSTVSAVGAQPPVPRPPLSTRTLILVSAATLAILIIGGIVAVRSRSADVALAGRNQPSVAVLYFENNTGNPQLDWLRTGLADMLVTDLSQSPDVEVLGTDRLFQILSDMKRQDDRVISFDTVRELSRRAGVRTVLLGSYMKAGDTIRINVKLQEASSGKIVTAERVEAAGESSLFATVDDLTRKLRANFSSGSSNQITRLLPFVGPIPSTDSRLDRDLTDVTTSSLEAYRYYADAINLHDRGRYEDELPLLEKAVEIDPDFALAFTKLAAAHYNLSHFELTKAFGKRAVEHADKLTLRERYYVEADYYSNFNDTIRQAIDIYSKAVERYPDFASARNNLALLYVQLERFDEAIREYEELRRRGITFGALYETLAFTYAAAGHIHAGEEVLREFLKRNPENWSAWESFGSLMIIAEKPNEAMAAFDKAVALNPRDLDAENLRRLLHVLNERWPEAEAIDRRLRESTDSTLRWQGHFNLGNDALYRGRTNQALKWFEIAVAEGSAGSNAVARNAMSMVLLASGHPRAGVGRSDACPRRDTKRASRVAEPVSGRAGANSAGATRRRRQYARRTASASRSSSE
jgi:serine/threonine protein kinase/tetratricopeptide (TPR) repeat protein